MEEQLGKKINIIFEIIQKVYAILNFNFLIIMVFLFILFKFLFKKKRK